MLNDLRYAVRLLIKSPGFSLIAVATLALGIGANTAIFSVVESALLRPLPFPGAERLVRIYETFGEAGGRSDLLNLSERTAEQWREYGKDIFEGIATATGGAATASATATEPARIVPAARVSANFLNVLGLSPALGRNFTPAEDQRGGPRVAIIGHDFWQRNLGGRADVLGQTVDLDDRPYTIVGVMPKTFRHPYRAEVWLPLALNGTDTGRNHYLYGAARLRPGISLERADAAARRMCSAVNAAAPDATNPPRAELIPLRDSFVMDLRPKLLIIALAALSALLIAAANFAGLMLARVVERDGEMSLRAALGATRGQLVRQGLVQTLLLAGFGTVAGLLLTEWLTPALLAISPEGMDATGSAIREFDYGVRLDWPVFCFAVAAMLLIGFVFGLVPAWRASRTDLRGAIGNIGRGSTLDGGTRRLLGSLIVIEIAIAAVLLVGSLTLTQYFRKVVNEPWGFSTEHRLIGNAMFSDRLFDSPQSRARAVERTLMEVRALPSVRSASVTVPSPMEAARDSMGCAPEGTHPAEPRGYFLAYRRATQPGYFATIGQSLLRGHDFAETDRADSPPVCIINDSFARRFWPGQDPVGKRVKQGRLDGARPWLTVVGVVADTKSIADSRDGEMVGTIYIPIARAIAAGDDEMTFIVETSGKPGNFVAGLSGAIARVDHRIAAYDVISLEEAAARSWVTERFLFVLVSLFGVLGLLLAAIGVYGLLALQVTRRTREFGIRVALGATAHELIRLVAAQGAQLLVLGFSVGGIAASMVLLVIHRRWPEVPAMQPLIAFGAGAILCATVALASWFPARRASGVDPTVALRAE